MHDSRSRDQIDDVIDEAARSMTEGVPGESLRHGVRMRIDERPHGRRGVPGVPVWQMGLAAASIAVIALVVGQNLSGPSDPITPSGVGATRPVPDPVVADAPVAAVAGVPEGGPDAKSPTTPDATVPRRNASGAEARTGVLPAVAALTAPRLLVIESLEVEPIGPRLMAVESIPESMPIEIEPLRVEPLSME